jgi:hypothetical protein
MSGAWINSLGRVPLCGAGCLHGLGLPAAGRASDARMRRSWSAGYRNAMHPDEPPHSEWIKRAPIIQARSDARAGSQGCKIPQPKDGGGVEPAHCLTVPEFACIIPVRPSCCCPAWR